MEEILLAIFLLIHSSGIALGVGSSTIAIAGFLTAIADNNFDESERRIMGVVYFSLRFAMVTIVLFTLAIMWLKPDFFGWSVIPLWIMTVVLFVNAVLMTKHWISGKLGPAIQAGTWYSLGFLLTLYIFDLAVWSLQTTLLSYVGVVIVAIIIVNACLEYLGSKNKKTKS